MEYGHIDSKLENVDECYLCGNSSESLMGYYSKFDTVGIIGLNEWYVLDLRLKEYESSNGFFDKSVVEEHLCQGCLDKVTETLEGYFEEEKEEYLPFCLVDFKTLDIYPIQKMNMAYPVRDYWVELDYNDTEIELVVYYLPGNI